MDGGTDKSPKATPLVLDDDESEMDGYGMYGDDYGGYGSDDYGYGRE